MLLVFLLSIQQLVLKLPGGVLAQALFLLLSLVLVLLSLVLPGVEAPAPAWKVQLGLLGLLSPPETPIGLPLGLSLGLSPRGTRGSLQMSLQPSLGNCLGNCLPGVDTLHVLLASLLDLLPPLMLQPTPPMSPLSQLFPYRRQ